MNSDFELSLGQNIRRIREEKKLTQQELSAKLQLNNCDITRSTLAKIEVGQRHIYPDEIFWIRKILDVSYDDLFPKIVWQIRRKSGIMKQASIKTMDGTFSSAFGGCVNISDLATET